MPEYTHAELTAPLTENLLKSQPDPAGFQNARVAYVTQPTNAVVVTEYGGRIYGRNPISPQAISLESDADAMRVHLINLGMSPVFPKWNNEVDDSAHHVDWAGDPRRFWQIGPMSVGQLMRRYAGTPAHIADEETRNELKINGMLK